MTIRRGAPIDQLMILGLAFHLGQYVLWGSISHSGTLNVKTEGGVHFSTFPRGKDRSDPRSQLVSCPVFNI
jgi:hypothetical protein